MSPYLIAALAAAGVGGVVIMKRSQATEEQTNVGGYTQQYPIFASTGFQGGQAADIGAGYANSVVPLKSDRQVVNEQLTSSMIATGRLNNGTLDKSLASGVMSDVDPTIYRNMRGVGSGKPAMTNGVSGLQIPQNADSIRTFQLLNKISDEQAKADSTRELRDYNLANKVLAFQQLQAGRDYYLKLRDSEYRQQSRNLAYLEKTGKDVPLSYKRAAVLSSQVSKAASDTRAATIYDNYNKTKPKDSTKLPVKPAAKK